MAYIRRLPSGKFQATVRHPSGRKLTKTDPLKRVVQAWANETEAALRNGASVSAHRRTTVEQWHSKWSPTRNVEPATAAKNDSHWRTHIQPQWGTWPLSSIKRSDVQGWVTGMSKTGVGATTVSAAYHFFAALMKAAQLEGLIDVTPCVEIDLPKVVKPAPRWLTVDEYERIQLALADRPRPEVWQAYLALACHSGLRPGELAGLDVGDVDLSRHLVYVHQVMTRKGMRDYGKTSGSTRWVPFPQQVADLLWRLIGDRASGPVFTTTEGERIDDSNFRSRIWRPALKAAGVAYVDPYTTRHTAASWLAQAGLSSDDIADLLGHTDTRMVRSTYRHLDPQRHDRVRALWGARLEIPGAPAAHAENEKSPRPAGRGL